MPLTLKNVGGQSASAGTDALAVAGSLFDRATKSFVSAAEDVQQNRAAKEQEEIDTNTRQLMSELRGARPEDVAGIQATIGESAQRRFGGQFDAGKLDTAVAALPGQARERVLAEQEFEESQAIRNLQPGTRLGTAPELDEILGAQQEIEAKVADLPLLKQDEARQALRKSRGITTDKLLEGVLRNMPEGSTQEDYANMAARSGATNDQISSFVQKKQQATGEAARTAKQASKDKIDYANQQKHFYRMLGQKEAPIADKEILSTLQNDINDLVESEAIAFFGQDREQIFAFMPAAIAAGLSRDEITTIVGNNGKKGIFGGTDVGQVKDDLRALINVRLGEEPVDEATNSLINAVFQ